MDQSWADGLGGGGGSTESDEWEKGKKTPAPDVKKAMGRSKKKGLRAFLRGRKEHEEKEPEE